jgi:hypothetical protein
LSFLYLAKDSSNVGFSYLVIGLTFALLSPIMIFLSLLSRPAMVEQGSSCPQD